MRTNPASCAACWVPWACLLDGAFPFWGPLRPEMFSMRPIQNWTSCMSWGDKGGGLSQPGLFCALAAAEDMSKRVPGVLVMVAREKPELVDDMNTGLPVSSTFP